MKTLTKSIALATFLSMFASQASAARYIKTEIMINATPEKVWSVLMDFKAYPEWSRFIQTIEGEQVKGSQLSVSIVPPNEKGMTFKPTVLDASGNNTFRWIGGIAGTTFLFAGEHYFILSAGENNTTHLEHGERFSGIFAPLLWLKIKKNTPAGFENFNQALKQRAEK